MHIIMLLLMILLKIIVGICLIVILLSAVVLFTPIRYQIYFEKYEQLAYEVHIRYLPGVKGYFTLEDGKKDNCFKVFGKVLYSEKTKEVSIPLAASDSHKGKVVKVEPAIQKSKQAAKVEYDKVVAKTETKESIVEGLKGQVQEEVTIKKETKVQEEIEEKVSDLAEQVGQDATKQFSFDLLKERSTYLFLKESVILLKRLLVVVAPKSWDFEVVIGKEDPADTGECIAKLTMFYPLYYRHGIIKGNYERECLEGGFLAEGKFRLASLLRCLIGYICKPVVRKMIKKVIKR